LSTAASAPSTARAAHEDDGSSAHGNQVMLGVLAACIASSVTMIIVSGVTGAVWVLVIGVAVMAVAVGVMLSALSRLIGTEHETYGEA
jgi:hypothetical protein